LGGSKYLTLNFLEKTLQVGVYNFYVYVLN